MNKVELVAFKAEHVDLLKIRAHELNTVFKLANSYDGLKILEGLRTAWTVLYDGRILGVIGYFEMWPGVFEAFLIPSIYLTKYAVPFARIVKRHFDTLAEFHKCHRVQAIALNDALHDRWLTYLGFSCEGVLKEYNVERKDYKIWARLFRWE